MKTNRHFASRLFNDKAMKKYLLHSTYRKVTYARTTQTCLDEKTALEYTRGLFRWAKKRGAKYYSHIFQPLSGTTAEKLEKLDLSHAQRTAKQIQTSENDASSFPSGGLRATFEARGYTSIDISCHPYLRGDVLFLPTLFCSDDGTALDQRTPLIKSNRALNLQMQRIFRILGYPVQNVTSTVGIEQEYFMVSKAVLTTRPDLALCGRTLVGSILTQKTSYLGAISPKVALIMKETDDELSRLGIDVLTQHNEVAPCQYEIALNYAPSPVACFNNHLVTDTLCRVANRHGMTCLFAEKPFTDLSGSGKHNNWSLQTQDGTNLLQKDNGVFGNELTLLTVCAVLQAIEGFHDLLLTSVCTYSNQFRLGKSEAPPQIISVYLGKNCEKLVDDLVKCKAQSKSVCLCNLLNLIGETDRNRTSPVAFNKNKFEFRLCGSSSDLCDLNVAINTAVAESLGSFADYLERNGKESLPELLLSSLEKCKRILYDGDCYGKEWLSLANARNLVISSAPHELLGSLIAEKNVRLFAKHGVFSRDELYSRYVVSCEKYVASAVDEAQTLLLLTRERFLPNTMKLQTRLAEQIALCKQIGINAEQTENDLLQLQNTVAEAERLALQLTSFVQQTRQNDDLQANLVASENAVGLMQKFRILSDRATYFGDLWNITPVWKMLL